jgi:hypothetical protein
VKKVSAALTVLVLAALPAFGAGASGGGPAGGSPSDAGMPRMKDAVAGSPGYVMKRQMGRQTMRTPQHLLMMAYHGNVMNFGQFLYGAADQGATVPPQLARVAVSEMRRSVEEMEKYRASALQSVPFSPERQRMVDEHLVQVKTQLRELEQLVKQDQIDSDEVKKHLEPLLSGCREAGCTPMSGGGEVGRRGGGPPMHGMMREGMLQKAKSRDAELARLVQEMEQAPREKKLDLVVETVARMVRQRAEMTSEMEKARREMMQQGPGMMPGMMDEDTPDDEDNGWDDEGMEDD